jgi:hypothetical protein
LDTVVVPLAALALVLAAHGPAHAAPCVLTGAWTNTLQSTMELVASPPLPQMGGGKPMNGTLTGIYHSDVGVSPTHYPLRGTYVAPGTPGTTVAVAFTASFTEAGTTSAWSGRVTDDGQHLHALWLLSGASSDADGWRNTLTNKDVFTRAG